MIFAEGSTAWSGAGSALRKANASRKQVFMKFSFSLSGRRPRIVNRIPSGDYIFRLPGGSQYDRTNRNDVV
jgi:hypothetical protein